MNCQEVIEVLDSQDVGQLGSAQRQQVAAHVAACTECARVWNAQASVALLPGLALSAEFASRCRRAVASPPGSSVGGRGRVLRWSSLAALAAAAALVFVLLRPEAATTVDHVEQTAQAQLDPVRVEALPEAAQATRAAELTPVVAMQASPVAVFTVRVIAPDFPVTSDMARDFLTQPPPMNSVSLETLRQEWIAYANDAGMQPVMQSFYTAMLDELRTIPGLALVGSDPEQVTPTTRHYTLQIRPAADLASDGHIRRRDHRYMAFLEAAQLLPGGTHSLRLSTTSLIDPLAVCAGNAELSHAPCADVRGTAVAMVRKLRQSVFPPDASVRAPLQARFQDSSLDPAQRVQALGELFKLQTRSGDRTLLRDAGVVRATIQLAAEVDPAQRVQLWRGMRGVGNPDLIEPLIASLRQDSDDARLAAADILAADFSEDPRARSALELASVGDAKPLVRAVAQRGLSGDEQWWRYIVASLEDSSLPARQRVEAFAYYLYQPGPVPGSETDNPQYWEIWKQLDDAAVRGLAEALPAAGRLQAGNQGLLLISNFGYQFSQNPAVTEMLLRYLEHDPWNRYRTVAGEVLARTHGSDPQVRAALLKAVESDPDQSVRDWIRQIMAEQPPIF